MENNQGNNNQQAQQTEQPDTNRPETVLRDGNLKATVWKNEGENGAYYSTTLSRTWQDEEGNFRDSHSFSGAELLRVSELARGAYARTNELRQEQQQQHEMPLGEADPQQEKTRKAFKQQRTGRQRRLRTNVHR